jgi:hypothetical protein
LYLNAFICRGLLKGYEFMDRLTLSTGYVLATIITDLKLRNRHDEMLGRSLPGGWGILPASATLGYPELRIEAALGKPALSVSKTGPFTVRMRLVPSQVKQTLPYLVYTILERVRQERGMCTMHGAAAIAPSGEAVLLLGDKGAGKTSVLSSLVARGFIPAGDDLVVLKNGNQLSVLAGNRISQQRRLGTEAGFYESKTSIDLDRNGFLQSEATIREVVRVNVHALNQQTAITSVDAARGREALRLHENLGRYIHGVPTPFLMRGGVPIISLPSLDCGCCMETRAKMIRKLLSKPVKYLFTHTASDAADMIGGAFHG